MHFEVSHVVKVPRDKTYAAYTDFEGTPRWSKQAAAVTVSRREGNTVYLEGARRGSGRRTSSKMRLFPPERVESEGEARLTRTKRVVRFDEVPEGTKITASLDVEFKGRWGWLFKTQGRDEAESSAQEELASFATYLESLWPGPSDRLS